jgi:hypothetical protein
MDRSNAAKYLPFVQALAEGKELQIQLNDGTWSNIGTHVDVSFSEPPECYRIKPKPKEVWLIYDSAGNFMFRSFSADGAKRLCDNDGGRRYEHYKQVL